MNKMSMAYILNEENLNDDRNSSKQDPPTADETIPAHKSMASQLGLAYLDDSTDDDGGDLEMGYLSDSPLSDPPPSLLSDDKNSPPPTPPYSPITEVSTPIVSPRHLPSSSNRCVRTMRVFGCGHLVLDPWPVPCDKRMMDELWSCNCPRTPLTYGRKLEVDTACEACVTNAHAMAELTSEEQAPIQISARDREEAQLMNGSGERLADDDSEEESHQQDPRHTEIHSEVVGIDQYIFYTEKRERIPHIVGRTLLRADAPDHKILANGRLLVRDQCRQLVTSHRDCTHVTIRPELLDCAERWYTGECSCERDLNKLTESRKKGGLVTAMALARERIISDRPCAVCENIAAGKAMKPSGTGKTRAGFLFDADIFVREDAPPTEHFVDGSEFLRDRCLRHIAVCRNGKHTVSWDYDEFLACVERWYTGSCNCARDLKKHRHEERIVERGPCQFCDKAAKQKEKRMQKLGLA